MRAEADRTRIVRELEDAVRHTKLVAFDFDGVFTDNMVYVFEDGTEAVRCSRGDGLGLAMLRDLGVETIIVSTEPNPVVSARAAKLGIRCLQGLKDKRAALEKVAAEMDLSMEEIAYVGNDVNDTGCLTSVGLPIVVADAHAGVVAHARYQTTKPGGEGAVREVCDLFTLILRGREGVAASD